VLWRPLLAVSLAAGLLLLIVALYLAFMTATDYRPPAELALETGNNAAAVLARGTPFSVLTFNIGYCGMEAGADFFMDSGRGSRGRSREQTRRNLERIAAFLDREKADLLLLQEVDRRASRSFQVDERRELERRFAGYGSVFALNYKVPWVPVPLLHPMGAVQSGLLTFSRFRVRSALRRRLPGQEGWPRQLAELDRCALESRLPLAGGGELVLFHLHLSVFDKGGRIRRQQLAYVRERLLAEFQKGNHVIAGGDWNHGLPGSDPKRFPASRPRSRWYMELPPDFTPPGFRWALDPTVPSVRSSASPYRRGESFVAVIDGFLVSANVEVRSVGTRDLGFENSDHNPVTAVLVLK
jgi:endonuclease/exonuclease/phosphatase family metal-dependent hydrolase